MTYVRQSVAVAFAWLALGLCAVRAESGTTDQLNTYFEQAYKAGKMNGNVLVADHGKVIFRGAFGYADGSRKVPLTLSDRFDIGSISKEFDAVGIMILAQEGKLKLSDPVSKFVPGLPSWSDTVTVDQLMHYTSGLPDVDWNTVTTDEDALRNLRALKTLDFPAGTRYAYGNNNTVLRKKIIEKASGMPFPQFLEKYVFPKAGIRDAVIDPTDTTPRVARSFDANFKPDPMKLYLSGWTQLTVDDFFRWSNCINTFCLISPASTRQMVTTQNPKWQTGLGHGDMVGDQLVHHRHDGNNHNFEALLLSDDTKGRTIILITNKNIEDVYAMADAMNAILDGKPYVPLSEVKD